MAIRKKIKLLIFLILFLIISPIVVLYANGVIFSEGWSLLKTGGIYVASAPVGSDVYLNNKFKDKISFFQRDLLIKNLKPGMYDIQVKKDGYNTWLKKIKVVNNLVSDADVFMMQEKVEVLEIPKYIVDEANSTSTKSVKIKNQEYTDIMSLFNATTTKALKTTSTSSIDFKSNLGKASSPIMNNKLGLWKEKNKIFVKWFGRNEASPKYLCDNTSDCTKSKLVFELAKEPIKINYLPGYEGVVIVATESYVFAVQIEENPNKKIQTLYTGKKPDFRLDNNNLYIKDGVNIYEILL
jgi:hypothetical protein